MGAENGMRGDGVRDDETRSDGTRRGVLRGLLATAVAVVLSPLVTASRPAREEPHAVGAPPGGPSGAPVVDRSRELAEFEAEFAAGFDEMYGGSRIRGTKDATSGPRASGTRTAGAVRAAPAGSWRVTVDDRPLPLMRRADGGYLTMIDHYQSYPTPLAAARAAVDELGGTLRLREAVMGTAEQGEGHGHGVHA
ncbi:tyrosinase family oxidase copper chaperone [Streptomyces sp. CWNU-52B]|uniref:tyrosinase family oxidase copper chaperone n=1 Tax=unclassified Streptomyces TaxID=2593676 RepID=UPI0039BEF9EE